MQKEIRELGNSTSGITVETSSFPDQLIHPCAHLRSGPLSVGPKTKTDSDKFMTNVKLTCKI